MTMNRNATIPSAGGSWRASGDMAGAQRRDEHDHREDRDVDEVREARQDADDLAEEADDHEQRDRAEHEQRATASTRGCLRLGCGVARCHDSAGAVRLVSSRSVRGSVMTSSPPEDKPAGASSLARSSSSNFQTERPARSARSFVVRRAPMRVRKCRSRGSPGKGPVPARRLVYRRHRVRAQGCCDATLT